MLSALLPHGQELLMTAASRGALEATLAELEASHETPAQVDAAADLRGRIVLVEQALAQAQVVPDGVPERAAVGTMVEVDDGRKQHRYVLTVLAPPDDPEDAIAVSVTSPVGAALIGTRVGETATVALPDGRRRELRVVEISLAA